MELRPRDVDAPVSRIDPHRVVVLKLACRPFRDARRVPLSHDSQWLVPSALAPSFATILRCAE